MTAPATKLSRSAKRRRTPMGKLRDFANKIRRDMKKREGRHASTTVIFDDLKRLSAEQVRLLKDTFMVSRSRFYNLYDEFRR